MSELADPTAHTGRAVLMSGRWYNLPPEPRDVDFTVVLRALCGIRRYNGQLRTAAGIDPGWTVGHHTLSIVRWARAANEERNIQLGLLLHDNHEAWIGDIPGPVKRVREEVGDAINKLENDVDDAIFAAAGYTRPTREELKLIKYYHRGACSYASTVLGCDEHLLGRIIDRHGPADDPRGLAAHSWVATRNADEVFTCLLDEARSLGLPVS